MMNPDGQSQGAALIRGFEYCLSLLSTWLHKSKVRVRLLTRVRLKHRIYGNQSLFKWWHHLHYWQNNSQRQFEHRKFDANL